MGFGYILTGLIFFFNPNINIVDFLPDVIGCIFLFIGLYKLSDVETRFFMARKLVYYMLPLYAIKLVLSVYIPVYDPKGVLPYVFCFSVTEAILLIFFFTNLYGAIEYTANLKGGEKHLSYSSTVTVTTMIFIAVKYILNFVPEIFDLVGEKEQTEFLYNELPKLDPSVYKPYAVLFCFIATLILGICCLFVNVKFFEGIRKDRQYIDALASVYKKEVLDNKHLLLHRRFRRSLALMIAGSFFMFDFTVDGINLIPDIIGYLMFFAASLCIFNQKENRKKAMLLFLPLFAASLVSYAFKTVTNFGINHALKLESLFSYPVGIVQNGSAILIGTVIGALEGVLYVIFMTYLWKSFRALYEENLERDLARSVKTANINNIIFSALSLIVYVLPLVTAYYRNLYEKTGLADDLYLSNCADIAHNYAGLALILFTAYLIFYIFKINKRVSFRI